MSDRPLISVVIPCFNSDESVHGALRSIVSQRETLGDLEVVLVDDHSTSTSTRRLLDDAGSRFHDVTVVENEPGKKGISSARNLGASITSGKWLLFLDSDDFLVAGGIFRMLEAAEEHRGLHWVGGDINKCFVDRNEWTRDYYRSRRKTREELREAYEQGEPHRYPTPFDMFIRVCVATMGAAMVSRAAYNEIGGFSDALRYAEDYEFWLRLANSHDYLFVPESVLNKRIHGQSYTAGLPSEETIGLKMAMLNRLARKRGLAHRRATIREKLRECYRTRYYQCRSTGDVRRAVYYKAMELIWRR